MKIVQIESKNSIKIASKILLGGGVLVFPTDTVYGIGCLLNEQAVMRLYKIKNRPLSQPTAVLMTKKNFQENFRGKIELKKFFEEKLTLLLSKKFFTIDFPNILIKDNKIGIRLPRYSWLEKLFDKVGPMVASSANIKGDSPPSNFTEINEAILKQTDLAVKTDKKLPGTPSRIYDSELKKYYR